MHRLDDKKRTEIAREVVPHLARDNSGTMRVSSAQHYDKG
jgi:hypothetical protein